MSTKKKKSAKGKTQMLVLGFYCGGLGKDLGFFYVLFSGGAGSGIDFGLGLGLGLQVGSPLSPPPRRTGAGAHERPRWVGEGAEAVWMGQEGARATCLRGVGVSGWPEVTGGWCGFAGEWGKLERVGR